MTKTLSTLFAAALFAVLFAGAAMAVPADPPVPEAQPATVQAVEDEPAPAVTALATEAPLCQLQGQGPPPDLEECGDGFCPPKFYCCNPLENLCVREGQVCIQ